MSPLYRFRPARWPAAVAAALWLCAAAPPGCPLLAVARGQAPDLQVLLVGDTEDPNIGPGCQKDLENMTRLFKDPESRPPGKTVSIAVFSASKQNFGQDQIEQHFKAMPVGPNTGVVFYFSGHGSYSSKVGHIMRVPPSAGAKRGDYPNQRVIDLALAQWKDFRQLVVVSDSCAPNIDEPPDRGGVPNIRSRPARVFDPSVIGMLFFENRGIVNINGCSEHQYAYGPANTGGLFTVGFLDALTKHKAGQLPGDQAPYGNGDGFLTWREFFPIVLESTENNYRAFIKEVKDNGDEVPKGPDNQPQLNQTPQAYHLLSLDPQKELAPRYRLGVGVVGKEGGGVLVKQVQPGSPAEKVFQEGDIILRIDKKTVRNQADFACLIDFAAQPKLTFTYLRSGSAANVDVTLQEVAPEQRKQKK
jgi:hypothetical protein